MFKKRTSRKELEKKIEALEMEYALLQSVCLSLISTVKTTIRIMESFHFRRKGEQKSEATEMTAEGFCGGHACAHMG